MTRRPEAPSLGVLAVSGIGVLAVLAFVAVLVFGHVDAPPIDRLTAVKSSGPMGMTVIVGRCKEQRVVDVAVSTADGGALWRVVSDKGSIERRYVAGADAPVEFTTVVPFVDAAPDRMVVLATIRRPGHDAEMHTTVIDVNELRDDEPRLGVSAPACPDTAKVGAVGVLFIVGASVVVVGYVTMVARVFRVRR